MKKILLSAILIFGLVNVYGQLIEKTHTTKTGIYNTISDLPFLNTDRVISINRDDFKSLRTLNKKYIKLMEAVVTAKNEKELVKANKKALDFFEDLVLEFYNPTIDEKLLGNYQLGHYYAFGIFDPYFDGATPSNIERLGLSPIDKNKAREYFDKIQLDEAKGLIQLIPNTWYYNIEQGLASVGNMYHTEVVKIIKYLDENDCNFNPQKVCRYSHDFCDLCETNSILPCKTIVNLLYAIEQLPTTSPIRKQLSLDLNADEIAALALSYDKSSKPFEALYYGALAAVRGNANGYIILVDKWSQSLLSHYKDNHPEDYKAGLAHMIIPLRLWLIKDCLTDCNVKNIEQICDNIETYYNELADELYSDYTAEQKAKKKARRRETWRQLGLAFAGALQQTSIQMSNFYSQSNYANMGNFNSLLDPRLTAMQVNVQYYAEFQDFCRYNKKADGSNYTYNEWLSLRGQALQNLKEQGVDLVAEQAEQNRQDRQEWRESLDTERKQRLNRLGADTSNMSDALNNVSSQTSSSSTTKSLGTGNQASSASNKDLDSKQQYQREAVSSDDYHFEKHVTLYIRNGNSNRVMFSNKDLCKKGAYYFVKIDNTYYRVQAQGGWGFNSSILYSSEKLYFNK